MAVRIYSRALIALTLVLSLAGCGTMGGSGASLFEQLGGMDQVKSLASAFVDNAARKQANDVDARLGETALESIEPAAVGGRCRTGAYHRTMRGSKSGRASSRGARRSPSFTASAR